jgi:hypothetical protein
MKYKVGDVVLLKDIHPPLHLRLHLRPRPLPRLRLRPRLPLRLRLNNTFGIITTVEKHTDIFEKNSSTENDNGYVWYSQVDNKEYYFYEDEVEGEVIK